MEAHSLDPHMRVMGGLSKTVAKAGGNIQQGGGLWQDSRGSTVTAVLPSHPLM